MSPDDDETTQSRLPPNVVAYNGVLTPYNNLPNAPDGRAHLATGNNEFITDEQGNRLDVGASDQVPGSPGAFASTAFAAGAFATNGDEDSKQPSAREDYTKTVLNRTDNPPPDLVFLTDDNENILTDPNGNSLTVDVPETSPTVSNFGFAEGSGSPFGSGTYGSGAYGRSDNQPGERSAEDLQQEMLDKVSSLELLIRAQIDAAPKRGHNHPPELLDVEQPVTQAQFQEALNAIGELRREGDSASPSPQNIVAQASVFQRIASLFKTGSGWLVGGVVGNKATEVFNAHQHEIYTALMGAAHAAMAWAQHLAAHL